MENPYNVFVTLEAWVADGGDGSASIDWFLEGQGPYYYTMNEQDDERWSLSEGSGEVAEVRRGGRQHLEAWVNAHAPEGQTFFHEDNIEVIEGLVADGWTQQAPLTLSPYLAFSPPTGWENT